MLWPPVFLESYSCMWRHTHLIHPEPEAKLNSVPVQVPQETDVGWN